MKQSQKNFLMPDKLIKQAEKKAEDELTTLKQVMIDLLKEYVGWK